MNVYIESGNYEYANLFARVKYDIVYDREAADLVVFTGGEDVSPSLYGDRPHEYTYNNITRDEKEQALYKWCAENNKPMVGICRGAQFLNVMNGGRMYQHVGNHTRSHDIIDIETGDRVYVTSTHHQMMMPSKNGKVLAKSAGVLSYREWFNGIAAWRDHDNEGIEVVLYDDTRCLCFQPHPEMDQESRGYGGMRSYFHYLVVKHLF
jgi:GMP synthase-like glutamine amidotransferase